MNIAIWIVAGVLAFFLIVVLAMSFFVSRRSQKIMHSLLTLMTEPERAKIKDATRILKTILADEIAKIESDFTGMQTALNSQIDAAFELEKKLTVQNDKLVEHAETATKKLALVSQRLDNTISGLHSIVSSSKWQDVELATDKFNSSINGLLEQINTTTQSVSDKAAGLNGLMDNWIESGKTLSEDLSSKISNYDEQMKNFVAESETTQQKLSELTQSTAQGFENVKTAATDYEKIMESNDKLLSNHLVKMDAFNKQSKKQTTTQLDNLRNTAGVVNSQVVLTESSIEKQIRKLTEVVNSLTSSASLTEESVGRTSGAIAGLTKKFNTEIKEFASDVVSELKTVSGVANVTLENTKTSANAFSESVKAMAIGVRETLIKMNEAHSQLSAQSESLIKMSRDTTAQLQPLSELIEKYYKMLPDLSDTSTKTGADLENTVNSLNEKIKLMQNAVAESSVAIAKSAAKLGDLAGQSRQQMIDLMSDYTKAVNTMQTLNKQMMIARATAPMEAIGTPPGKSFGRIGAQDFLKQSKHIFEKLHEQSIDLTKATGTEIPDIVLRKYHGGDTTIYSKWLAKVLRAANKKGIRSKMKSDAIFRSQAVQFIRSFERIADNIVQSDNSDKFMDSILKTDLGQIYTILKNNI